MLASADQMEEARRRNINANDLAMKPAAFNPKHLPQRPLVEIKADGIGLLDVNGAIQTLEGVDMACAKHLAGELSAIRDAFGEPMVLHGEYLEAGGFGATLSAFRSGDGQGCCFLWDAVPLKAWHGHEQSLQLGMRRALLEAAMTALNPRMVRLSPAWLIGDGERTWPTEALRERIEIMLNTALEDGHEGLVVKDLDSPYVRARSPFWMKMKGVETVEGVVQGVRLEDGSDTRMRAVILNVDGKPVFVGSGLSEAQRADPSEFSNGRVVEFRHVGKLSSGAYRGAAFVRFRDDKERPHG